MMKVLAERDFPIEELHLLASARSVGQAVHWKGHDIPVEMACDEAFKGMDIVLGAAENDIAKQFAPAIVKAGAVFVDNSSAFRMDPDVPLIVPEINPEDVKKHKGIISNPNCTTIVSLVAINALMHNNVILSLLFPDAPGTFPAHPLRSVLPILPEDIFYIMHMSFSSPRQRIRFQEPHTKFPKDF